MLGIRVPQQNVVDDFAAIYLELFTNEVASIRLKLKKDVYEINETASILKRLSALPSELTRLSDGFDLTDAQVITVEQLAEKISDLSELAKSLLTSSEIARNTRTEFQPDSPKASSDKTSVELKRWRPAQTTAYSLNDEQLLVIYSFLSFGNLANCLRVNKFFNQVTPLSPIQDSAVFLSKSRKVFLNLLRLNATLSRPPQLSEILDERKKAKKASRFHFWKDKRTKLEPIAGELQKRIGLAKGPGG